MGHPNTSPLGRVLLALYGAHPQGTAPDQIHLQKEMYFLTKRHPRLADDCEFSNYLAGPWSETVRETNESLQQDGFIRAIDHSTNILSDEGREVVEELRRTSTEKPAKAMLLEDIHQIVEFFHQLTREETLLVTYVDDAETTELSLEQHGILGRRVEIARGMYERGVVSLSRASELAGLTIRDVRDW